MAVFVATTLTCFGASHFFIARKMRIEIVLAISGLLLLVMLAFEALQLSLAAKVADPNQRTPTNAIYLMVVSLALLVGVYLFSRKKK